MDDPWTDEQEIALLKAVVFWKPVGMHKHFRMLAIRDYMVSQGVVNPDEEHTRIPGIWKKLASLYDLPTLDEREDSIMNDAVDENGDVIEYYRSFDLPMEDYERMMEDRRFNPDGSESPNMQHSRRESTVADTDEPRSSPAPRSARGSVRGTRTSARKGRTSRLREEVEMGNSRRTSKANSVADDDTMEGDEEEQDSEGPEDEGESPQEEDEKGTVGRRTGRSGKKNAAARGSLRRGRRK